MCMQVSCQPFAMNIPPEIDPCPKCNSQEGGRELDFLVFGTSDLVMADVGRCRLWPVAPGGSFGAVGLLRAAGPEVGTFVVWALGGISIGGTFVARDNSGLFHSLASNHFKAVEHFAHGVCRW